MGIASRRASRNAATKAAKEQRPSGEVFCSSFSQNVNPER